MSEGWPESRNALPLPLAGEGWGEGLSWSSMLQNGALRRPLTLPSPAKGGRGSAGRALTYALHTRYTARSIPRQPTDLPRMTQTHSPVRIEMHGHVALVLIDNPPVNAASHAVRVGLVEAIAKANGDAKVHAIVIACEGRTFVAGADIREFGRPSQPPILPDVLDEIEACAKPVVAAIHGTALGGGFEIGLACHARVLSADAVVGHRSVISSVASGNIAIQPIKRAPTWTAWGDQGPGAGR